MTKDNEIEFKKPEPFVVDPITDVLRTGARKLLTEALEAEKANYPGQNCFSTLSIEGLRPPRNHLGV